MEIINLLLIYWENLRNRKTPPPATPDPALRNLSMAPSRKEAQNRHVNVPFDVRGSAFMGYPGWDHRKRVKYFFREENLLEILRGEEIFP